MAGKVGEKMKKILAVVMMGMLFTATCAFAEEAAKTEAAPAAAAATTKDACEPGKVPAKKHHKKHKKHKKAMANATTAVKK